MWCVTDLLVGFWHEWFCDTSSCLGKTIFGLAWLLCLMLRWPNTGCEVWMMWLACVLFWLRRRRKGNCVFLEFGFHFVHQHAHLVLFQSCISIAYNWCPAGVNPWGREGLVRGSLKPGEDCHLLSLDIQQHEKIIAKYTTTKQKYKKKRQNVKLRTNQDCKIQEFNS